MTATAITVAVLAAEQNAVSIPQLLGAAIVALLGGGAVGTWITAVYSRRKTDAETGLTVAATAEKITGVATSLLEQVADSAALREAQLMGEMRKLEMKVDTLHRAVDALSDQIRDAGLIPVWPPHPPGGNG